MKAPTEAEADFKAAALRAKWDEIWAKRVERDAKSKRLEQKRQKVESARNRADRLSLEAAKNVALCDTLLVDGLKTSGLSIDWESRKKKAKFKEPRPTRPKVAGIPQEPQRDDAMFATKVGFLGLFLRSHRERRELEARKLFERYHAEWLASCQNIQASNASAAESYSTELTTWKKRRDEHLAKLNDGNLAIDAERSIYEQGDAQAVIDHCNHVLATSQYPQFVPRQWQMAFVPESKTLVVDLKLPERSMIPNVKEAKYSPSKSAVIEVLLKDGAIDEMYDSVVYQICLRTLHELFSTDHPGHLSAIALNGWVDFVSPSTGQPTTACIATVHAKQDEFQKIDLANVDPKACFKSLKGIGSSKLHSMAAVRPILQINTEDRRFVASVDVAESLEDNINIAAIGWQEFEHLIRELFSREFSAGGGEVKVTQASRDGGVDAVAFDPDPIRGGKVVIQAKRYTNTVDVSAVRDLYGTVLNEGATKGVLVTTSSFGPDSYHFAKDKPLTLMDGSNLLFLLEKHGHRARIDLAEAKKLGLSLQR